MVYLDMVMAMLDRATRLLGWPRENIFMQRGVFYSRPSGHNASRVLSSHCNTPKVVRPRFDPSQWKRQLFVTWKKN